MTFDNKTCFKHRDEDGYGYGLWEVPYTPKSQIKMVIEGFRREPNAEIRLNKKKARELALALLNWAENAK